MQEKNEKIQNGKEIVDQIRYLKNHYKSENEDIEKEEFSFLSHLNRLTQLILDDNSFSIYKALNKDSIKKWHKKTFLDKIVKFITSNFRDFLYFILLTTITAFLVSEAVTFYAIDGIIDRGTYFKAILTEVCFIFLSGYRSDGKLEIVWIGFLRVSIFLLMMTVITSETFLYGKKNMGETVAIAQQIEILEKQIQEKEKTIEFYMKKDWGVNVRKHTDDKNELVKELIELKKAQAEGSNVEVSKIEEYKMYGNAVFRILLLFISILITRRIFKF